ncbi:unnamed protein product [Zymoseptoria tritici ST99CH_1E4]|uniref:Uncharacterized protein n=2 Tax=Zymoseptoria tritici TaxID=1047171 RepID=F9XHZ5_ZYMTI|nr:uncharacterized protein MYCGRDRAFT_95217 [Zymoseptoria tritici IPO323]EGP85038.1 hypothetical protein MYCGRDRAFT_95217 [Zymoseptoria tritici IPO323]SMR57012.1 unnamed protein product [Zymoseptoria tritici ST99CH_1E4]
MPRTARGPRHRFLNDHHQDLQQVRIGSAGISRSHEDEYDEHNDDDNAGRGGYNDGFQQHDDWEDYDDRKDGWEDITKQHCSNISTPAYFHPPQLQPSPRAGLVSFYYSLPPGSTFSHHQLAPARLPTLPRLQSLESHSTSMPPYTQHTRNHHHRACTCGCQARAPCRAAPWHNTPNHHHVAMRSPPLEQHNSPVDSLAEPVSPEPRRPEAWMPFSGDLGDSGDGGYGDDDEDIEMDLDVSVVDLDVEEFVEGNGWNWGNDWIWVFDEHEIDEMDGEMSEADSLGYTGDESSDEGYDGDDEREWDEWWKANR